MQGERRYEDHTVDVSEEEHPVACQLTSETILHDAVESAIQFLLSSSSCETICRAHVPANGNNVNDGIPLSLSTTPLSSSLTCSNPSNNNSSSTLHSCVSSTSSVTLGSVNELQGTKKATTTKRRKVEQRNPPALQGQQPVVARFHDSSKWALQRRRTLRRLDRVLDMLQQEIDTLTDRSAQQQQQQQRNSRMRENDSHRPHNTEESDSISHQQQPNVKDDSSNADDSSDFASVTSSSTAMFHTLSRQSTNDMVRIISYILPAFLSVQKVEICQPQQWIVPSIESGDMSRCLCISDKCQLILSHYGHFPLPDASLVELFQTVIAYGSHVVSMQHNDVGGAAGVPTRSINRSSRKLDINISTQCIGCIATVLNAHVWHTNNNSCSGYGLHPGQYGQGQHHHIALHAAAHDGNSPSARLHSDNREGTADVSTTILLSSKHQSLLIDVSNLFIQMYLHQRQVQEDVDMHFIQDDGSNNAAPAATSQGHHHHPPPPSENGIMLQAKILIIHLLRSIQWIYGTNHANEHDVEETNDLHLYADDKDTRFLRSEWVNSIQRFVTDVIENAIDTLDVASCTFGTEIAPYVTSSPFVVNDMASDGQHRPHDGQNHVALLHWLDDVLRHLSLSMEVIELMMGGATVVNAAAASQHDEPFVQQGLQQRQQQGQPLTMPWSDSIRVSSTLGISLYETFVTFLASGTFRNLIHQIISRQQQSQPQQQRRRRRHEGDDDMEHVAHDEVVLDEDLALSTSNDLLLRFTSIMCSPAAHEMALHHVDGAIVAMAILNIVGSHGILAAETEFLFGNKVVLFAASPCRNRGRIDTVVEDGESDIPCGGGEGQQASVSLLHSKEMRGIMQSLALCSRVFPSHRLPDFIDKDVSEHVSEHRDSHFENERQHMERIVSILLAGSSNTNVCEADPWRSFLARTLAKMDGCVVDESYQEWPGTGMTSKYITTSRLLYDTLAFD